MSGVLGSRRRYVGMHQALVAVSENIIINLDIRHGWSVGRGAMPRELGVGGHDP